MDLRTLQRGIAAAEELHAAGHCLHAFATLHALAAGPPRRGETVCRVRAAEMIIHAARRSRSGSAAAAAVAQLDLVQTVLAPMMSRRFFEGVVVAPLLWCSKVNNNNNNNNNDSEIKEEEEEEEGDCRVVPVALVVRAYALSAIVHRRRLRHGEAAKCVGAAAEWCSAAFRPQPTVNNMKDIKNTEDVQEAEERRCCEAFLAVEFCRVYYSQLVSVGTTTSSLSPGAAAAANHTPNTAAIHSARKHTLSRLLHHAKGYAGYVASADAEQPQSNKEKYRECSVLCFSSPKNSFSIQAAARVLAHYYCLALILDHRVVEAEKHIHQCGVLFGISPELQSMMQLIVVGLRGPLAWKAPRGLNQQGNEQHVKNDECQVVIKEEENKLLAKDLYWLSDGLLDALKTYLAMYAATTTGSSAPTTAPADAADSSVCTTSSGVKLSFDSGPVYSPFVTHIEKVNNKLCKNNPVQYLFQRTLRCIDEQLTVLTTDTISVGEFVKARQSLLHSSSSSNIRFLVLLKCAALVTMSTYALSQLWLLEAVKHLLQLRRYMEVFHKHTISLRVHYHLIVSQLASMLSLRHLSGETDIAKLMEGSAARHISEKDEEEKTVGFDVGLPYAHILAAEAAALHPAVMCLCSPSTMLLVSLMKGAAISHTSRVGSVLHISDAGLTVTNLTLHQRCRCAVTLVNVLQALKTSFAAVSVKLENEEEDEEQQGGERDGNEDRDNKEVSRQQMRSAWTVSNHILLLLLSGAAAVSEDKDELTAIYAFRDALRQARENFGAMSGVAAECLYLLAMAYNESERAELHAPKESISFSETGNEELLSPSNGITDNNAQQTFSMSWRVASHARKLTLLHCVLCLQSGGEEENRDIVNEWNMEVRSVCSVMRRELMEVLSL